MIRGPEWDRRRKQGLGGSDAAAALGISRWKTPLKLYKEKRGEIDEENISDQQNVFWGTILEPIVRRVYVERTGRKVRCPSRLSVDRDRPHAICNPDFFEVHRDAIGEIKCINAFAFDARDWGDPESAHCPIEYYAQAQHNLRVTRRALCVFPILIGGQDYRVYNVPRNEEWIARVVAGEDLFWNAVLTGIEPTPIDISDLVLKYPKAEKNVIAEADVDQVAIHRQLVELSASRRAIEKVEERGKMILMDYMGEAERLRFGDVDLASWLNQKGGGRRFTLCGRNIYDEIPDAVAAAQQEIAAIAQGTPNTYRRKRPKSANEPPAVPGDDDALPAPTTYHGSNEAAQAAE